MISQELREVFEKLIPVYEDAVVNCPIEHWQYLNNRCLDWGLCHAAYKILGIPIYNVCWYDMFSLTSGYIYKTPYDCDTREEAVECLQWRINVMKKLLNNEPLN